MQPLIDKIHTLDRLLYTKIFFIVFYCKNIKLTLKQCFTCVVPDVRGQTNGQRHRQSDGSRTLGPSTEIQV